MVSKISIRNLTRTFLFGWTLSLGVSAALASQEIDPEYHADCDPPNPYGGKVTHAGGVFYYLSDIEDCGDHPLAFLVSWIRNTHTDQLIITWEADGIVLISRPASNPLPPGEIEDGSHPICGYDENPRTNTILSYTQQPIKKRVAAYLENASCGQKEGTLLRSHVRTAYEDSDGTIQHVEVEFQSVASGETLTYAIGQINSTVDIAIGGLSTAIDALSNEQQITEMQSALTDEASKFDAATSFTTLDAWNPDGSLMDSLPSALATQKFVIFDTREGADKHYLEWHIPTGPFAAVKQVTAPMVLLDSSGNVITTRPVGLYMPQVGELKQ